MGGHVGSLGRALTLLAALGSDEVVAAGGNGVGEFAALIGRDKSQISRTLATLAEAGFAERDPMTRRYRLGWMVFVLAARSGDQRLISAAQPVLTRLVRETGESSHLSVLRGDSVLTLLTESPGRAVHAVSWVGRVVPVMATSSGRA
ncbi:MAG: helix-turn-helix domain-containing protein, partial [Nocardioidaceae bacterium]|nr:helix-turn-helix domain-containing protein [Nocardioidaceae bacterium]